MAGVSVVDTASGGTHDNHSCANCSQETLHGTDGAGPPGAMPGAGGSGTVFGTFAAMLETLFCGVFGAEIVCVFCSEWSPAAKGSCARCRGPLPVTEALVRWPAGDRDCGRCRAAMAPLRDDGPRGRRGAWRCPDPGCVYHDRRQGTPVRYAVLPGVEIDGP